MKALLYCRKEGKNTLKENGKIFAEITYDLSKNEYGDTIIQVLNKKIFDRPKRLSEYVTRCYVNKWQFWECKPTAQNLIVYSRANVPYALITLSHEQVVDFVNGNLSKIRKRVVAKKMWRDYEKQRNNG